MPDPAYEYLFSTCAIVSIELALAPQKSEDVGKSQIDELISFGQL